MILPIGCLKPISVLLTRPIAKSVFNTFIQHFSSKPVNIISRYFHMSLIYVWLTWLIDQSHEEWQYNNQLPWRRVLHLVLSITLSVFYQPVSTARTNVNVRSQQPLPPLYLRLKGLICESCDIHCFPLGELPASDLPLPYMSPGAVLSLKCSNNTLSKSQHVPAVETVRWRKRDLCRHYFLKPVI